MQQKPHPSTLRQEFFSSPAAPWLEIRSTFESAQPYALHCHKTFSVGIMLHGTTRFLCDGVPSIAEEGEIVLIEPGVAHQCNPVDGASRSYHMLHIDTEWISRTMGLVDDRIASIRVAERVVRDSMLFQGITAAVVDFKGESAGDELEKHLAGLFSRYCFPVSEAMEKGGMPVEQSLLLCPEGGAPVAESARRAGVCRETFIRSFRKKSGLSPGAYRHCLLLEKGRRLLRSGAGIAETAQMLGYCDQSHFHRMFVKYLCATPRQYVRGQSLLSKK